MDIEPLYYVLIGDPLDHRIWHSYLMAVVVLPVIVSLAVFIVERHFQGELQSTYRFVKLKPTNAYSLTAIYVNCVIGGFSHIFLDMFTHESMPFLMYPLLMGNPLYLGQTSLILEGVAVALAFFSLYFWWKESQKGSEKLRSDFSVEKPIQITTKETRLDF